MPTPENGIPYTDAADDDITNKVQQDRVEAPEELAQQIADSAAMTGSYAAYVVYDGDVSAARPITGGVVLWLDFPSEPTNMDTGDLWLDLTASGTINAVGAPPTATGYYLSFPQGPTAGTAFGAADRLFMSKVWLPAGAIDRMACEVTAQAAAGGKVRMGIWKADGTNGFAGTLVVDSGQVASDDSTGIKTATVSATIATAGWYWIGVAAQAQTCSLRCVTDSITAVPKSSPATASTAGVLISSVTGAFGNSPGAGSSATAAPVVHLRWT